MTEEEVRHVLTFNGLHPSVLEYCMKKIRSYGDSREKAGIERAVRECESVDERTMASLIRDLPVPAQKEPER